MKFAKDVWNESKGFVVKGAKVLIGAATFLIGMGVGAVIAKNRDKTDETEEEITVFNSEIINESEEDTNEDEDEEEDDA